MFGIIVVLLNVLVLTKVNSVDLICDSETGANCVCNEEPCFRKCCQLGEIYENEKCVKYNGISSESVHLKLRDHHDIEIEYSMRMVKTLIYGVPCYGFRTGGAYLANGDDFKLFVNGSMELIPRNNFGNNEGYSRIDIKNYCSDITKKNSDRLSAIHCPVEEYEISDYLYYSGFCIFVSLPFLLVTEAIFVFINGISKNLAGKITVNQIFALIVSFLILADIRYVVLSRNVTLCVIFGYLVQYSILSNFFWLNVMCFDIWLVFSGLSTPYRNLTKDKEWRKFLKYAAYAWGMPILICFATYLAEYLPKDSKFRPGVGEKFCLLQKNYSRLLFYFGPLTVILIANVLMFSATAYKIFEHKKQMKVLKSDGNNINNNTMEKERLNLYFKLFLVMGITWIAEPISELFNEEPDWLWTLLDSINLLQGIPIFIIFVCKRRTLRAINAKLCPSKQFFGSTSTRRQSSNVGPRRTLTSTSSLTSCCAKNSVSITPSQQNNDLEMVPKENNSKSYNLATIA